MTKDEQAILNDLADAVYYLVRIASNLEGVTDAYLKLAENRIGQVSTALKEMQDA